MLIYPVKIRGKDRGFSITELIIAIIVIMSGILTVLSVMAMSLRLSTQTRHRSYAHMVAENMVEKFRDHRYGEPEPASWTKPETSRVIVEGVPSPLTTDFNKKIQYKNGSFVGKTQDDTDFIELTITWVEGTGAGSSGQEQELIVKTEVRRDVPH